MRNNIKPLLLTCVSVLLACSLFACGNNASSSSASSDSQEEAVAEGQEVTREEVEEILYKASEATFTNVSFTTKTETTATGATANGVPQTQTIQTTMSGQFDKSGEKPKLHLNYSAVSTMELGKTGYEMFIDSENLIVKQNEQLFVDAMTDEMLNSYANSVTSVTSPDEIGSMLDMAASYKIAEDEDETTVSITIDKDKLAESGAVDESSLPDNNAISTMVMSYTVGPDDRFKTVRIMSSTSGTPTYRVHQSYQFSDYDNTALPEWPDLKAYIAERSGIQTDANGRMFIVGDDGQTYYVSEIGDDGMIYYDTGTQTSGGEDSTTYYYDVPPAADAGTATNTGTDADTSGGSTEDQGRAYITADDGTIHFLDEEGSRIINNEDGSRYFIDADGNFYFLAE